MSEGKEYLGRLTKIVCRISILQDFARSFVRVNAILDHNSFDRELRKTVEFVQSHVPNTKTLSH